LEPHKLDSEEDDEKLIKRLRAKKIQLPVLTVAAATFTVERKLGSTQRYLLQIMKM
jgi:DNA-directed RNA polymerase subunit H (RpoH/RPB5)